MNDSLHGYNLITVKENNISLIIKLIHKAKICSRADLAIATGLKQATITNIVNNLMSWGIVKETGHIEGRLKRRSIGVTIDSDRFRVFGIRLNRSSFSVGLFNMAGKLISKKEQNFNAQPCPDEVVSAMIDFVREMYPTDERLYVLGIGLALPGPFIPRSGTIELMSGFPGWEGVKIAQRFKEYFSVPVFLEHDANCGALGELWYGNIGQHEEVVYVASDIGVGAGVLTKARLLKGYLGTAGEIGHMSIDYSGAKCECGGRGCLELYCSTNTLVQNYKQALLMHPEKAAAPDASLEDILTAVANGDAFARNVFAKTATFLAIGIVNIVNMFNPSLIIISDRISLAGPYLIEVIDKKMKSSLLEALYNNVEVRLGTFRQDSILYGAGALVLETILENPSIYFSGVLKLNQDEEAEAEVEAGV